MSSLEIGSPRDHRPFVIPALGIAAVLGSGLGGWMVLQWLGWLPSSAFAMTLRAHGLIQTYGFVALFTMGVAILMICNPMHVAARPRLFVRSIPVLVFSGIGCGVLWSPDNPDLGAQRFLGPSFESLAAIFFIAVLWITRKHSLELNRKRESFNQTQLLIMTAACGWLLIGPWLAFGNPTEALETVLWGFAAQFIFAVGARSHTAILSIRGIYEPLLPTAALVLNFALVLRWLWPGVLGAWLMGVAVSLYLICLRPFRFSQRPAPGSSWLRVYVRTSYLWLIVTTVLTVLTAGPFPELAGATRHALGSGFILTMIVGLAFRMIPAFEVRRIPWRSGPWVIYGILLIGTAVRVSAQALGILPLMAFGGFCQLIAIWLFAGLLTATSLWGQDLTSPDFIKRQKICRQS